MEVVLNSELLYDIKFTFRFHSMYVFFPIRLNMILRDITEYFYDQVTFILGGEGNINVHCIQ